MQQKNFDVIIAGGSFAGLSAAMSLGRALRNVLVIDSGKPCNASTPQAHILSHMTELRLRKFLQLQRRRLKNMKRSVFIMALRKTLSEMKMVLQ